MFGKRKIIKKLEDQIKALLKQTEAMKSHAYIIGIERNGRVNQFIFKRGDELIQIETISLMSDNLPEWKEKLLR